MAFEWTPEQLAFHECKAPRIRVKAFAGASKTTSLEGYTKRYPRLRFLYVAYNRSIADEGKARFPSNVKCMTSHQLAFKAVGRRFQHKLGASLRPADMRAVLGTSDWAFINAVIATVNAYLCSDREDFHEDHLPLFNGRPIVEMPPAFIAEVFLQAREVWRRMIDPEDTTVPHLHDAYLKLYYLSKPDLGDRFDVILADEAQDLNGITLGLIKNQSCRVIFVGDPHQSLYAFRGADNALSDPDLDDSVDLYLTKSFRFGPAVATVANIILSYKGEQLKIVGAGQPTQIKTQLDEGVRGAAYLCRTVSGVIMTALEFAPQGRTLYWVGGIEAYQIGDLEDLVWFSQGKTDKVRSKRLLKDFPDWTSYLTMAKESKDREMARLIKVVSLFPDIEKRLARLRTLTQKDEKDADVILSTAHRSKGLEWKHVYLGEDFPDPLDPELPPDARRDELNLLYVAATRAKHQLAINSVILGIMRDYERSRRRALEHQMLASE